MRLNHKVILLLVLLPVVAAPGCIMPVPTEIAVTSYPVQTKTLTPEPTLTLTKTPTATVTLTLIPSETPTITPSPTPFSTFPASVWADHVNVRANPGYLFQVILNAAVNTSFMVLGKAPGGEWTLVQSQAGTKGWIFTQLLESEYDLQAIPVIEPNSVQRITGKLVDEAGHPISGVQFAITQESAQNEKRNDAMTDVTGEFIAFMPLSASGTWDVTYVAIACTSNTMDADCNCKDGYCGTVYPQTQTTTLPQGQELLFAWK
jgi:SH3-like domain-containing protein